MTITIIFSAVIYLLSVLGCKMYNDKIYSKKGNRFGMRKTRLDSVSVYLPIINTILSVEYLLGNTKYKRRYLTILLLLVMTSGFSQPVPKSNNGKHHGWDHNHHGAPLDGTKIMLIMCISYGIYKLVKSPDIIVK